MINGPAGERFVARLSRALAEGRGIDLVTLTPAGFRRVTVDELAARIWFAAAALRGGEQQ